MCIASLLLGIISILGGIIFIIPTVLAIVFGHVSLAYCKRNKIEAGQGMSIAGLIMGYLSIAIIPVVGLLAAMAIPAFQKVRSASQEKAMINNVRQLAAAADQYYLEYGTSEARYSDIVGLDKFVKNIHPILGEKYPDSFLKDRPVKIIKPDGSVLVYDPNTGQIRRER
jgi:type IV pilus assembly protein PilA